MEKIEIRKGESFDCYGISVSNAPKTIIKNCPGGFIFTKDDVPVPKVPVKIINVLGGYFVVDQSQMIEINFMFMYDFLTSLLNSVRASLKRYLGIEEIVNSPLLSENNLTIDCQARILLEKLSCFSDSLPANTIRRYDKVYSQVMIYNGETWRHGRRPDSMDHKFIGENSINEDHLIWLNENLFDFIKINKNKDFYFNLGIFNGTAIMNTLKFVFNPYGNKRKEWCSKGEDGVFYEAYLLNEQELKLYKWDEIKTMINKSIEDCSAELLFEKLK